MMRVRFIEPGKARQNAFVERFNGKFRDECLNLRWFRSLRHARGEIGRGRYRYRPKRPRSSLGYPSPTEVLKKTTAPALEPFAVPRCRSTLKPDRDIPDQAGPVLEKVSRMD